MENFEALIKARLDTSGISGQIKNEIEAQVINLTNFKVDGQSIVRQIEAALNTTFNIKVNPIINGNGNNVGKQIAQQTKTAVDTSIKKMSIDKTLADALKGKGVDDALSTKILDSFRKDVGLTSLELKTFSAQFEKTSKGVKRLKSIKFSGIDEDGKTVEVLSKIDKKTGVVSSELTRVTQKFGGTAKASTKADDKYKKLLATTKEIGKQEAKIARLDQDKNKEEHAAATKRLNDLKTYKNSLNVNMTSDQTAEIDRVEKANLARVNEIKGHITDSLSGDVAKIKVELDEKDIDADIAKLKKRLEKLTKAGVKDDSDIGGTLTSIEENEKKLKEELNKGNQADSKKIIDTYDAIGKSISKAKNDLTILESSGQKMASLSDVAKLDSKMAKWLKTNSNAAKDFGGQIEFLRAQLKEFASSGEVAEDKLKEIDAAFSGISAHAALTGKTGASFGSQLKKAFTGFVGLFSVGQVFDFAVDKLRDMYQAVYDIDTAMTNLKKVTNESESTYSAFLERSADSAQDLGRTVSSLVEQTASWSKLGYSLSEAEELSKLSSIYANVAEVSDDTAVSDIVTALKAYGLEVSEASMVVDSLNELGNKFATDAASLGQGLSNSASAMNLAGADVYETLAMITGITEITQDASGAGNALKISSMRIRGMKGQLEELGEEVDSNIDSISKVQTQILNLTGGKVNIFDDSGEFRNYYDIMKEIADIYEDLSSTDQASLSELLFGKNRGNQGAALIQAFQSGQIEKAYTSAVGSAGSAAAEQEAWMESLEAKTQQFQAAWQSLSMTVLDSNFLKVAVDTGTVLLNVLENIVDILSVPGAVAAGGGLFAFFKNLD